MKTLSENNGSFSRYFYNIFHGWDCLTPKKINLKFRRHSIYSISDCWKVLTSIDSYPAWRNDIYKIQFLDQ
jgi:hypothetical protein